MKFKKKYIVKLGEIDCNSMILPYELCSNWQDATTYYLDEINATGFKLHKIGLTWIINAMTIEFTQNLPLWGENYEIETWATNNKGVKLLRDFIIKNDNNQIISKGSSSWAIIDLKTRKPIIYKQFENDLKISTDSVFPNIRVGKFDFPLETIIEKESKFAYTIKASDLDFNGHFNNIKYIRLFQDAIPAEFLKGKFLHKLYIQFKSELLYNENITIRTYKSGNSFFNEMIRKSDGYIAAVCKFEYLDKV